MNWGIWALRALYVIQALAILAMFGLVTLSFYNMLDNAFHLVRVITTG
jgi:hypothetical protein